MYTIYLLTLLFIISCATGGGGCLEFSCHIYMEITNHPLLVFHTQTIYVINDCAAAPPLLGVVACAR